MLLIDDTSAKQPSQVPLDPHTPTSRSKRSRNLELEFGILRISLHWSSHTHARNYPPVVQSNLVDIGSNFLKHGSDRSSSTFKLVHRPLESRNQM